ncbi:MAG TPA: ABC transporter ATP-binding protein [Chloroflexaceae bacterium]|nr:ABC transporter ATP-binding protein [Chloroflexaceae bacterium]
MQISLTQYYTLLRRYLAPQRGVVAGLAVLLLASMALQLAGPQVIRAFIDSATGGASQGELVRLALIFVGVAVVTQAAGVGATYLSERVAWTATNALRLDLALHTLRLDMPFHKANPPGALIERIDGDVSALATFFSQFALRVVGSALLLAGALALLFREDWRVGAALTAFAAASVVILGLVRNFAVPFMAAERAAAASLYGLVEERVAGLDDVRANGGGPHALRRMHQAQRTVYQREIRAAAAGTTGWLATMLLFAVGYGLALGLGSALYTRGLVTLGTVYLCFQYTQMLRQPLEQLADQIRELQKAAAGIVRIGQLTAASSRIADAGAAPLPAGPLAVELDGVTFAYDDAEGGRPGAEGGADQRPAPAGTPGLGDSSPSGAGAAPWSERGAAVIQEVSLALRPGEVLGLLGRTGSGKTTVTRLLLRLYDPQGGAVRLGGVDLRDVPLAELRRRVGVVTQEVQLFRASLRDNLTLFDPEVADERIWAALEELGMAGWARALPGGLNTVIDGSEGLSAGEAQLLAFARVFLLDPGLVILDEASSRLDPATERRLERAVGRLLEGRTAVIIAHRLATVQRADRIAILEGGRVREEGPREALAADRRSRFSELLRVGMEEVLA